ncbi:hypothetical protein BZL29_8547 [Mycobacterium kansasii]|uniref:Uncharacterized protein n=1 Tax=Mycobacterium kansasii TaxID=1768 RepID=A0A1V3WAC9_MYCKA|nr:hypothetical protein BZL29_8547 [Mycobacterium kansasii]
MTSSAKTTRHAPRGCSAIAARRPVLASLLSAYRDHEDVIVLGLAGAAYPSPGRWGGAARSAGRLHRP